MPLKNLVYYAVRERLEARAVAAGSMLLVGLFFLLLTALTPSPAAQITAISLTGVMIAVVFCTNMYVSLAGIANIYRAPQGYWLQLLPVPSWKLLFSKIVPAAIIDTITLGASIAWVLYFSLTFALEDVWQLYLSGNQISPGFWGSVPYWMLFGLVYAIVNWAAFLALTCMFSAAGRSIFHRIRAGWLVALVTALAAAGILSNLLNLLFIPIGVVQTFGPFVHIMVPNTPVSHALLVVVSLMQSAAYFCVANYLTKGRLSI